MCKFYIYIAIVTCQIQAIVYTDAYMYMHIRIYGYKQSYDPSSSFLLTNIHLRRTFILPRENSKNDSKIQGILRVFFKLCQRCFYSSTSLGIWVLASSQREPALSETASIQKLITCILCCSPNPVSACRSSFLSINPELSLS